MKIFGVTGWKNSGKTGLVERLVAEFIHRGLSVSTVKHAHHTFDVDGGIDCREAHWRQQPCQNISDENTLHSKTSSVSLDKYFNL